MAIRSPQDALRAARTVLTLGAEPIGGRLEMVPGSRRLAGRRGAALTSSARRWRSRTPRSTSTAAASAHPAAQRGRAVHQPDRAKRGPVARLWKKNPTRVTAAVASGVGVPAMLAEAWNRSDEQRAADYANVPDSVKNTGIVWMLPDEWGAPPDRGVDRARRARKPRTTLGAARGRFGVRRSAGPRGAGAGRPRDGAAPWARASWTEDRLPADAALHALEIGTEILASFSPSRATICRRPSPR